MKRLFLLGMVGILTCLPLQSHSRAVILKVPELPDFSAQDVETRAETAVVRRFQELYPGIELQKTSGLSIEGSANTMDMIPLMQIAGGISPDVMKVNFRQSGDYVDRGFLRPLDDLVAKMDKKDLARRVVPSIHDVCYRKGPDGKCHWYMLPSRVGARLLMYRRDLFAKAGLDPDNPPKTWTEFEEASKKLSDPAHGHYAMGFVKGDISSWDFANLVWSRGGDIVKQDKNGHWGPTFNTPEVIDAMYFYLKLTKGLWAARDGKQYRGTAYRDMALNITAPGDPFAMTLFQLTGRVQTFDPQLIGYAPMPYSEKSGESRSEVNATMYAIFAGVKDPKVIDAAFKYITFLNSDEANRIRTKTYIRYGYAKSVRPLFLKQFGYTDYLKQIDAKWVKAYEYDVIHGKPEPYGSGCTVIYREMSRPIEQALNDKVTLAALDRGDEGAVKARLQQIFDQAQKETRQRMNGVLPPSVIKFRHTVTLTFLIVTLIGFTLAFIYLCRHFAKTSAAQTPLRRGTVIVYLLLIPAAASILIWQFYPLLRGMIIAFQNYSVMGKASFAGLENFTNVLFEEKFWYSIYMTLIYTALYMGFAFIAPIVLALFLSEIPRGSIVFRTIYYLPAVLSGLVVTFLWKSFYTPTGLLNTLLAYTGIHLNISWLESPSLAMVAVMLPVIWAGVGPGCLIYLAALKTIPEEFYEAADMDGAGVLTKMTAVTFPGLKMLIMINAVGAFIGAFMSSDMIFAMTGGGPYTPNGTTEVVGVQVFYTAFLYLKFGIANAMGWVLGFMLIGLMMLQLTSLSRVEFRRGR